MGLPGFLPDLVAVLGGGGGRGGGGGGSPPTSVTSSAPSISENSVLIFSKKMTGQPTPTGPVHFFERYFPF